MHMIPLTYGEKIAAVKNGSCTQTIRQITVSEKTHKLNLKERGDGLLIHTWAGKPYHSKWDWRFYTLITETVHLHRLFDTWYRLEGSRFIVTEDLTPMSIAGRKISLDGEELSSLIERDWIFPGVQYKLEEVLMRMNGLKDIENTYWQVIRWLSPKLMREGF